MNRQRSTWSSKPGSEAAPRQAATSRKADIFTMNQEHPQPSPVEYENGDPDSWAETPTSNKNVEMDYEGDHVKRNEVGFGEIRKDTFDHKDSKEWGGSGKYDNAREAAVQRKAGYALDLSRELLRTDDASALMDQATELMALPARTIASTLSRIQSLSPDALPRERKVRRATACCKLASRMLPEGASEGDVERLATVVMTLDDPTLRSMLKIIASARVAQEEEEEEQQGHQGQQEQQAQQQQEAQQQEQQAQQQQEQQAQQQEQAQQQQQQQQAQQECMSQEDMQALDQMLAEECAPCAPAAPGVAPELTEIFTPPAAVPLAPVAAAPVASGLDVTFDDEDDGEPHVAGEASELASLFDEHPEVMAQREIQAASGGYGPVPATRTASASAKRIGQVKAAPAQRRTEDSDLANLWERPPAL